MARLRAIMPEDMGAEPDDDVATCVQMPPALRRCLLGATHKEAAEACLDELLGPPSTGDCAEVVVHLATLDPGFARGAEGEAVASCVREKTRAELSCIRAAGSLDEARACEHRKLR